MTEDKNKQIAVFRFGVIHEFVGGANLPAGQRRHGYRRPWVASAERVPKKLLVSFCIQSHELGGYPIILISQVSAGLSCELNITVVDCRFQFPVLEQISKQCNDSRSLHFQAMTRITDMLE